ncbi:TlpA family protein disulfide reductase [Mongoliitalea daihaiensis]|uniref:TlpA family protein disulfide reductase n=1 Tax=Mongoliitalea daihaiensis TaxID=2782006 RepID=UPI001F47AC4B|nr:TlpA disulfide reductase family protein [Mongoliitalea daihaiensis]UJP63616.1 TlpA family protein disulfide reductase [Mongoliitalea daihaiensis]
MLHWKKLLIFAIVLLALVPIISIIGLKKPIKKSLNTILLNTGLKKPKAILISEETEQFSYEGNFVNQLGETVALEDYKGKTLFVNVWATWCPYCREELPAINTLHQKFGDNNELAFLTISVDKKFEKTLQYMQEKSYSFPVVHAVDGLNVSIDGSTLPTTLVINPKGQIVFFQKGKYDFGTEEFEKILLTASN